MATRKLATDIMLKAREKGIILSDDPESLIDYELVDCVRFNSLIEDNDICALDLLIIDTEGYDYDVLKMIDFKKIKPGLIIFEHRHLEIIKYKLALKMLKKQNYKFIYEGGDTLAFLY